MTAAELHKLFYVAAYGLGVLAGAAGLASWLYGKRADEDRARRAAMVGVLKPRANPMGPRFPYPEFEFGDSGAVLVLTAPAGVPLFRMADDNSLTVTLDDRGRIRVSTLIRDRTGAAVAELAENQWKVNPGNAWDRNYSDSALEVRDRSADIVLQVRVVGSRVQFQARMYDRRGNGFAFGKGTDNKTGEVGGVIEMTGPNHRDLLMKIEPMFRYPSDLHPGELASTDVKHPED